MVRISQTDITILFSYACFILCSLITSVSSYNKLSDDALKKLPSPGGTLDAHAGKLLKPLLIPRVVGTEGSRKALQHFTNFFTELDWSIEYDNFTQDTVLKNGPISFSNFWATLDPPWKSEQNQKGDTGRLVLVAHYDSKIEPAGFIGATDSAAPCAMIMHVAKAMDGALRRRWTKMEEEGDEFAMEEEEGLMVLLLDGEEAFHQWTNEDSIYGARHLAETWEDTLHSAGSTFKNHLSSISLFVLLDLLGAPFPQVPSFFRTTHWAYQAMASIEMRLRSLGLLSTANNRRPFLPDAEKTHFPEGFIVSDDHLPFMMRGVDILHLIAMPFPHVWHTMDDDGDHLDKDTVNDWAIIVEAFVAEWYGLESYLSENGDGLNTISRMKRSNKTEL